MPFRLTIERILELSNVKLSVLLRAESNEEYLVSVAQFPLEISNI